MSVVGCRFCIGCVGCRFFIGQVGCRFYIEVGRVTRYRTLEELLIGEGYLGRPDLDRVRTQSDGAPGGLGWRLVEAGVLSEEVLAKALAARPPEDDVLLVGDARVWEQAQRIAGVMAREGYALTEDCILEQGSLKTRHLAEYLLPTAMDCPDIQTILIESGNGLGPFGAKGVGEPSLTPTAAAIANAVRDAIGGRVYGLPITPERVFFALHGSGPQ